MLTIFGRRSKSDKFCDGYSRRDFLTIGSAAAVGGLLPPHGANALCLCGLWAPR